MMSLNALEPDATDAIRETLSNNGGIGHALQNAAGVSQAISLKRIADTLEAFLKLAQEDRI